jgi:hypothetical protein
MLQENASLESLSISHEFRVGIKAEEYFVLVALFQHNTMLKTLRTGNYGIIRLTDVGASTI